ncbi:MAG: MBOAT family protein, partial [Prevotella sp.]|nr:MBOAT family protein [Prevotella sp.]
MIFNSFQFLWLFPLIFIGYYVLENLPWLKDETKHRVTNFALIVVSYGLYMQWKLAYALILLGVTAVTYLSALVITKKQAFGKKKYIIFFCALMSLVPLLVFKYYNFINESIGSLMSSVGIATSMPGLNWAIPIG